MIIPKSTNKALCGLFCVVQKKLECKSSIVLWVMLPYIKNPLEDLVFPINTMKQQAELPTIQEGEKRTNEKSATSLIYK